MNNNYFCHMVHFDYSLEEKLYTDPESINFTEHFAPLFLEAINLVKIYGLLTKLVRSRWLDIGQDLFLRVYGPRRSRGP